MNLLKVYVHFSLFVFFLEQAVFFLRFFIFFFFLSFLSRFIFHFTFFEVRIILSIIV